MIVFWWHVMKPIEIKIESSRMFCEWWSIDKKSRVYSSILGEK